MTRLCERRGCSATVSDDWAYGWCPECCEHGTCHHGNRPENCDQCFTESDLAYDAARLNAFPLPIPGDLSTSPPKEHHEE